MSHTNTVSSFLDTYPEKSRRAVKDALLEVGLKAVRKRYPTGRVPVKLIKLCLEEGDDEEEDVKVIMVKEAWGKCEKGGKAVAGEVKKVLQDRLVDAEEQEAILEYVSVIKAVSNLEQDVAYGLQVFKSIVDGKKPGVKGFTGFFTPEAFKKEDERRAAVKVRRAQMSKQIEQDKADWFASQRPSLPGKTVQTGTNTSTVASSAAVSPPPTPPLRASPMRDRPNTSIHRQILSPPATISDAALHKAVREVLLQLGVHPNPSPDTTASTSIHVEMEPGLRQPPTQTPIWSENL